VYNVGNKIFRLSRFCEQLWDFKQPAAGLIEGDEYQMLINSTFSFSMAFATRKSTVHFNREVSIHIWATTP
jgi:hypothetical protein